MPFFRLISPWSSFDTSLVKASASVLRGLLFSRSEKSAVSVPKDATNPPKAATAPTSGPSAPSWVSKRSAKHALRDRGTLLTIVSMSQSSFAVSPASLRHSEITYKRKCRGSSNFSSASIHAAKPLKCAPVCLSRHMATRSGQRQHRIPSNSNFSSTSRTVSPEPSSAAMLSAIFCTATWTSSWSAKVILSARLCAVICLNATGVGPAPAFAIIYDESDSFSQVFTRAYLSPERLVTEERHNDCRLS
jgi:hypothetical protein